MPKFDFERYLRDWGGGVGEKLAVGFDFDEQLAGRLNALEWDEYHCQWDEGYEWTTASRTGAWTLDYDRGAVQALRERDIRVPGGDAVPVVVDGQRTRETPGRECPRCEGRVVSERDLGAFPETERTTCMDALAETGDATHLCWECRTFWAVEGYHDSRAADESTPGLLEKAMGGSV